VVRTAAAFGALLACGCAGARVTVSADRARYPMSLSGTVRDEGGLLHDGATLRKVGRLSVQRTPVGFVYSTANAPSSYDISDAVNVQVASAGGEAVVNLAVSVSDACAVLNFFPVLNALPFWPGCVPVTITGDIVRRADASARDRAGP
jgi:hypothetical protein